MTPPLILNRTLGDFDRDGRQTATIQNYELSSYIIFPKNCPIIKPIPLQQKKRQGKYLCSTFQSDDKMHKILILIIDFCYPYTSIFPIYNQMLLWDFTQIT